MKPRLIALLAALIGLPALAVAQASHWPSLHTQLARDHVPSGSALERYIEDNQDFALLDPRELSDDVRIPPWLRVQWRKAHPEMQYDAADPTGGYPYVLKEAHEWMRAHPNLEPAEREQDVPAGDERTGVGANLRMSGAQTAPRSESAISIDHGNGQRIISASNNISGSGHQAMFFSTNGGTTFGQTTLPLVTGDAFHSDPTVDFTSDGTAWSLTIGINSSATQLRMRAYKSTNGGASWSFDNTFSGSQTQADKEMLWVDHSASSAFKDNIYAIWHNGNPAYVNRRTGPSGSWGTPLKVSGTESTGTAIGADIKTNAFGDVFALWPTTGNKRIFVKKSTNGGASYGSAVQLATTIGSFEIGVPSFNNRKMLIYVTAGAYRTASKNLVYAAWNDLSGESGCTSASQAPGSNVNSTCKTRIWFTRSTNGGSSWETPRKINAQSSLNDQFNPWLAVDESSGRIGIMYYDTVADPGRKKTDVWYQTSADDGVTFSAALKVTTAQTDETVGGADSGNQYGDYNGLAGNANTFFPSWTDRRNAAKEEVWTAALTEGGGCTPPPAPTSLAATAVGTGRIDLSWLAAGGATEYHVYRSTTSGSGYGQVGTTTSTELLRHRPRRRHDLLLRRAQLRGLRVRQFEPGLGDGAGRRRLHGQRSVQQRLRERQRAVRLDPRDLRRRRQRHVLARHPGVHGGDRLEDLPLRRHELHAQLQQQQLQFRRAQRRDRHRGAGRLLADAPELRPSPALRERLRRRHADRVAGRLDLLLRGRQRHRLRRRLQRHHQQFLSAVGRGRGLRVHGCADELRRHRSGSGRRVQRHHGRQRRLCRSEPAHRLHDDHGLLRHRRRVVPGQRDGVGLHALRRTQT